MTTTATPTAAPTSTPSPTPTSPVGTFDIGLSLNDPYVCGFGFNGQISGGAPSYTVSYTLTGPTTINLAAFSVGSSGAYTTPAGYLAAVPDGVYAVSVGAIDSGGLSVSRTNLFSASIAAACPRPTPGTGEVISSAIEYPGPFGNLSVPEPSSLFSAPSITPGSGDSGGTNSPPLATTGTNSPLLTGISILLMSLGGLLIVASRRRDGYDF